MIFFFPYIYTVNYFLHTYFCYEFVAFFLDNNNNNQRMDKFRPFSKWHDLTRRRKAAPLPWRRGLPANYRVWCGGTNRPPCTPRVPGKGEPYKGGAGAEGSDAQIRTIGLLTPGQDTMIKDLMLVLSGFIRWTQSPALLCSPSHSELLLHAPNTSPPRHTSSFPALLLCPSSQSPLIYLLCASLPRHTSSFPTPPLPSLFF